MIEIKGLTKKYGSFTAVDSLTFSIERGESVALLGANGAGKSTLIKCVLGLLDYSGTIEVNGIGLGEDSKGAKSYIGYIPQEALFYEMRVGELVRFFASLRGVGTDRAREVLGVVGLMEHRDKLCSELSGGMRQRLSFALAFLSEPPVLLLDEPTSNLDAGARADLLQLTKSYHESGNTVMFSSHRLDEVNYLADRTVFMKQGRVVYDGVPHGITDTLGLKTRMNISMPEIEIDGALSLLSRNGISDAKLNCNGIDVLVSRGNSAGVMRLLVEGNIGFTDFSVDEPTMEEIIQEVERNEF